MPNRFFIPMLAIAIVAIGFSLWKMSLTDTPEVQKIYRTTTPAQETVPMSVNPTDTALETRPRTEDIFSPDVKEKRWLQTIADRKASLTPEELRKKQRYFEVVESAEFLELVRNGANMDERHNFMADQGLNVTRNITEVFFRDVFPTGTPADYEPEMRAKLSQLITENGGLTLEVLEAFSADPRAIHWIIGQFQGDYALNGELTKWLIDVDQKSILPETPRVDTIAKPNATSQIQEPLPAPVDNTTVKVPQETFHNETGEDITTITPIPEGNIDLEAEFRKWFTPESPKTSEFPTEKTVETALWEHVSSERLTRAMTTLNQYGPQEGLRRLKTSDPELAKQLEPLLLKQQEND
ncbi:hypothetical protein C6503_17320 [Candidatus Poribacteria bacterium]|nr:MAG: hypothetical protein C6503_17320 [Candidatus Poribacteria bacterium]